MNTFFKLRKGKTANTILIDFRYGRTIRVRSSTNLRIKKGSEKYWDEKRCKIKIPNDIFDYTEINNKIKDYEVKIDEAIKALRLSGKLSQTHCELAIKEIIHTDALKEKDQEKEEPKIKDFISYFDFFLDFYSKNISPNSKKRLSSSTLKSYRNVKTFFIRYMKSKKIKTFHFKDFNRDFYYDFIRYCEDNNFSYNYTGSLIQKIKGVLNSAYENGYHDNLEFKKAYFSKFSETVNYPYVTIDELERIKKLRIKSEKLDCVRDIFLIGCNTGLRVDDLLNFLKNPILKNVGGKRWIVVEQKKTKNKVSIPVNPTIQKILDKRNGAFPEPCLCAILNKEIKSIAKRAKINEEHTLTRTAGGKRVDITKPKYKFISSHTARRSFCTNAYLAGMPPYDIMLFSGHKSEKVFYSYIKATVEEKVSNAAKHAFFN